MSELLTGNLLVAQSGGPTAVINATLAGVIAEALNHECIEEVYGALGGILGVLNENFIDLAEEPQQVIRGLEYTPGSALGACRYKISKKEDYERLFEVFEAHNIRYFFYIGGNDSQDTAQKIAKLADEKNYDMRVLGIPKTIDNDLAITDHCPGYGSAVKYLCSTLRQMALDHEAMSQHDLVSIVEVMGRSTGWLAAGTALTPGKSSESGAPHLIYMPEVAFLTDKFLSDVQTVLQKNTYCMVVVSEGIVDAQGNYVALERQGVDDFGNPTLGGVGEYLKNILEQHLKVKARTCKLGYAQRSSALQASAIDIKEAKMCGEYAVNQAVAGEHGQMVTLMRSPKDFYGSECGVVPLEKVANQVKALPIDWITEDGVGVTQAYVKYAYPLIMGEVNVPYEHGLPKFVRLEKKPVAKLLATYALVKQ